MRTLSLLQAEQGKSESFQEWLLSHFAIQRSDSRPAIVNLATAPPDGLSLYGSAESNNGALYDAVLEIECEDAQAYRTFLQDLQERSPARIALAHGYAVECTTVLHRPGFEPARPTAGYKLIRGLYLYDDLPDPAAKRMWAHHSGLATKVHVGLSRYARHWVGARLTPDAPAVRGFSDLHFSDEFAMRERYFDSDRGREEIIHDLGHFIVGGLERVFSREYVF